MTKWIGILLMSPLMAAAMGNPFRPSYFENPYPTGVREDCSHIYASERSNLGIKTYDVACLILAKSTPIPVGSDCHYDDYKQTQKYKNRQYRQQSLANYSAINSELMKSAKYGVLNVHKGQDYITETFYSSSGNLELELLAGKYCQQAVPKDLKNAFAPNVDVPAKIISLWDEDYITSKWSTDLPALSAKHPETDFRTLIELNILGDKIWNKMLSCANGNAEMARNDYYLAKFDCAEGEALKEEVKNYVQSVRLYFTTSFVDPLKINVQYKFELIEALNGKRDAVTSSYSSFPTFHPLFEQAILQMLIELYPVGSSDRVSLDFSNKKLGLTKDRPESALLHVISQYDNFRPDGVSTMGLWPSAGHSVFSQIQRTRMKMLQSAMAKEIKIQEFKGAPAGFLRLLPDFYDTNRSYLVDEMRALNKRYGL